MHDAVLPGATAHSRSRARWAVGGALGLVCVLSACVALFSNAGLGLWPRSGSPAAAADGGGDADGASKLLLGDYGLSTVETKTNARPSRASDGAGDGPRVIKYDWIFTISRTLNPDCYGQIERGEDDQPTGANRQHIMVNGQFPGPTVRVEQGDQVHIRVVNLMHRQDQGHNVRQGMTVHWHGLRMRGRQWHDGVGYVTQCPVGFNQSYTYVIDTADEMPGTHWWHAHVGLDMQDGLFGAFIITPRAQDKVEAYPADLPTYDEELPPMLVHGWWNHSGDTVEWGLSRQYPYWVGNPQSLLVNGKGLAGPGWIGNASDPDHMYLPPAPCDKTDTTHFANFHVQTGKSYLLRIIAAGALLPINVTIPGHELTVIQAGGVWLEPVTVQSLLLNLGQRYSVILRATAEPATNHPIIVSTWGRQAASPECVNEFEPLVDDPSLSWGDGPTLKDFCTGADVNYRLPAGQAVLKYSGANNYLDAGFTGVNWYQAQNSAQRDEEVRIGIRTQTMFKPLAPTGGGGGGQGGAPTGYNPPVPKPNPRDQREPIDLLFNTWWPGELPPKTAALVAPGIVSAPQDAQWFRWAVQNVSFSEVGDPTKPSAEMARVPLLAQSLMAQGGTYVNPKLTFNLLRAGEENEGVTKQFGAAAFDFEYGEVVDMILNNEDPTEVHPWHLHGHCFHVLGMGEGAFDPERDASLLNTKDPVCLDTITVMYKSWAYIRFTADNPGLWMLHCHMEAHLVLGMGALIRTKQAPADDPAAPRVNVRAPPTLSFLAACPVPLDDSWNADAFAGPSNQYLPFTNDEDRPDARQWEDPGNYWVPRSQVKAPAPGSRPVAVLSTRSRGIYRRHSAAGGRQHRRRA